MKKKKKKLDEMVQISFVMSKDLYDKVREQSEREESSVSAVIRSTLWKHYRSQQN